MSEEQAAQLALDAASSWEWWGRSKVSVYSATRVARGFLVTFEADPELFDSPAALVLPDGSVETLDWRQAQSLLAS